MKDHIGAIPYLYQKLGSEDIQCMEEGLLWNLQRQKFEKKDAKLPKEKNYKRKK